MLAEWRTVDTQNYLTTYIMEAVAPNERYGNTGLIRRELLALVTRRRIVLHTCTLGSWRLFTADLNLLLSGLSTMHIVQLKLLTMGR